MSRITLFYGAIENFKKKKSTKKIYAEILIYFQSKNAWEIIKQKEPSTPQKKQPHLISSCDQRLFIFHVFFLISL
jgi:hypothetical protein